MIRSSEFTLKQRFLGITVAQTRNKMSNEVCLRSGNDKVTFLQITGHKEALSKPDDGWLPRTCKQVYPLRKQERLRLLLNPHHYFEPCSIISISSFVSRSAFPPPVVSAIPSSSCW